MNSHQRLIAETIEKAGFACGGGLIQSGLKGRAVKKAAQGEYARGNPKPSGKPEVYQSKTGLSEFAPGGTPKSFKSSPPLTAAQKDAADKRNKIYLEGRRNPSDVSTGQHLQSGGYEGQYGNRVEPGASGGLRTKRII